MEKEMEENIWIKKIFFWRRRKGRKIFGEGKYFLWRRRRTEKKREGKYHGGGKILCRTG